MLFFVAVCNERCPPYAFSGGRDFARLQLLPNDRNHASFTDINFRADFSDRYASTMLHQFPNSFDVRWRYACLERISVQLENGSCHANAWPLDNVPSPNYGRNPRKISKTFEPPKLRAEVGTQVQRLNIITRYATDYDTAFSLIVLAAEETVNRVHVEWKIFKTRLPELPRSHIWISDTVQTQCITREPVNI